MELILDERTIHVTVQYGKREKMVLDVTPEGLVTAKVPKKTPEADILAFVKRNKKQILDVYKRLENRVVITRQKTYEDEEKFLFLGRVATLKDLLPTIPDSEEETRSALKQFYTSKTREIVKERVRHYEGIIGVKSSGITIVDSPKSWGTCNSKKELTFNYRLSMSHPAAIDYVVIHELCHLLHLNHDRSFWRKVGLYCPSYKDLEDYLAQFGGVMTI
ncbi:MAG: M48 family metallopeptidase [Lachnospiraceae bacterium]|nr:M48 family metallopeptidase [Lachnospiraceae bacterium]